MVGVNSFHNIFFERQEKYRGKKMIIFYKIIVKIIISMHIKEGTELYVIMNTFKEIIALLTICTET